MSSNVLYIGASFQVFYEDARDGNGDPLNAGTCSYAVLTRSLVPFEVDGEPVTGTMPYVAASDGNYRGVLGGSATTEMTPNVFYCVRISFAEGDLSDVRDLWYAAVGRDG